MLSSGNWWNIGSDGWGVTLKDKSFKGDITDTLCSTIDNKPVVSMANMFKDSKAKSVDLSSFDTSKVTGFTGMFHGCTKIKNAYARNTIERDKLNDKSITSISSPVFVVK